MSRSQPSGRRPSKKASRVSACSGSASLAARQEALPLVVELGAALADVVGKVLLHAVGHQELRVLRPAVGAFGALGLVLAERVRVGLRRVLLLRRAEADDRVDDDDRRPVARLQEGLDRTRDRRHVVGVGDAQHLPAVGEEPGGDLLAEGEFGVALDGDGVVVVDPTKVRQTQMPGDRGGLGGDALHQVAVRADRVDVVVEQRQLGPVQVLTEVAAAHRHADGVRHALAEGPGGGLDAGGEVVFRVARRAAVELAELLDVLERHGRRVAAVLFRHAGEVQQRVEQH